MMHAASAHFAETLRNAIDSQAKKLRKPLCLVEVTPGWLKIQTFQEAGARRIVYRSDKGYTGE